MQSPDTPLVILPAAGYGRRVGSPESKEMLPLRNSQPLIDQALEKCIELKWPMLLVTREEKKSLIDHVESYVKKGLVLSICFVGATEDWPDSLLQSQSHWKEWNLVVLPDTEYEPKNIWQRMWSSVGPNMDLIVAQHTVDDSKNWGVLKAENTGLKVGEKLSGEKKVWGLFMFNQLWGAQILSAQLESQKKSSWFCIEGCGVRTHELDFFKDLTRGR